ncbi:hypothetical protein Gotri_005860 [Gossypium trilobum]|uniref:Uncharacterized protein n=1 Tax=Gossypium trilobum TaxID=34281 RepID=A0A7J9EYC9_9ROSI|nr:hypothetical protein [Gossypium trilobum]
MDIIIDYLTGGKGEWKRQFETEFPISFSRIRLTPKKYVVTAYQYSERKNLNWYMDQLKHDSLCSREESRVISPTSGDIFMETRKSTQA